MSDAEFLETYPLNLKSAVSRPTVAYKAVSKLSESLGFTEQGANKVCRLFSQNIAKSKNIIIQMC